MMHESDADDERCLTNNNAGYVPSYKEYEYIMESSTLDQQTIQISGSGTL